MQALLEIVGERLATFVDGLDTAPAARMPLADVELKALLVPPGQEPADPRSLIDQCVRAACAGPELAGPSFFAYVPNGGLVEAGIGELLSQVLNRYVPLRKFGQGLAAIEDGVLQWMATLFGLPEGSGGLLTTGGSQAMLAMVVAARERMRAAGGHLENARLYVSDQVHHCVAKAAHIAGLPASAVRSLPTRDGRHLDAAMVDAAVHEDRAAGRMPFLLIATAGTTNAGSIDPLEPLADVARAHGLWFHVDACYGGFFILTGRGRERLGGIERADSITLDPHKSLFLPFGTGALLVRDRRQLAAAHSPFDHGDTSQGAVAADMPDYLQDVAVTNAPECLLQNRVS